MTSDLIAVTGASGNIGGAVVRELSAADSADVVAVVRDSSRLSADTRAAGVRVADYDDRTAIQAALRGVSTLVFVASDGEAARMLVHHRNVVNAAVHAGVRHVVYLSIVDLAADSPFCYATVHRETERMLRESRLPHTSVRAAMYAEFFARWVEQAASSGVLRLPMRAGRLTLVSRDDVARCLAAVARRPTSQPSVVTGERTYGLDELAHLVAEITGSGWPPSTSHRPSSPTGCSGTTSTRGGSTPSPACSRPSPSTGSRRSPTTYVVSPAVLPSRSRRWPAAM